MLLGAAVPDPVRLRHVELITGCWSGLSWRFGVLHGFEILDGSSPGFGRAFLVVFGSGVGTVLDP